jgi:hypothetical protein
MDLSREFLNSRGEEREKPSFFEKLNFFCAKYEKIYDIP